MPPELPISTESGKVPEAGDDSDGAADPRAVLRIAHPGPSTEGLDDSMGGDGHVVSFTIDAQRLAIPLLGVERIIPAVAVTCLPNAPHFVLGVINVQGQIVPVMDLRSRCGLQSREPEPSDLFILVRTSRRLMALQADTAEVIECDPASWISAGRVLPRLEGVHGVIKDCDGLIVLCDLDALLPLDEEACMAGEAAPGGGAT